MVTQDPSVTEWVADRLDVDARLRPEVQYLVLAALESESALADQIDGSAAVADIAHADSVPAAGAFLKQIEVQGFRGIGPLCALDLNPAPGLTIVSGRNGSGKSSFAEGLEVALTGSTYRFSNKRSVRWQDGWRNIHEGKSPRIVVTLAEAGAGLTRIVATWDANAGIADAHIVVQRPGGKQEPGLAALGWQSAVETHRPLLSYDELGALLTSEPSKLYDALSIVLGLDQITDAVTRLASASKMLNAPKTALDAQRRAVIGLLTTTDDERATTAASLVTAATVDVVALRAMATGAAQNTSTVRWLRQILAVAIAPLSEVIEATDALTAAVGALAEVADDSLSMIALRSQTLRTALELHKHGGDQECPVCGTATLNQLWAADARSTLANLDDELSGLRSARDVLESARLRVHDLVRRPLPSSLWLDGMPLIAAREAVADRWREMAALPDGDLELTAHVLNHWAGLHEALTSLHDAARPELESRDDAWAVIATQVGSFADAVDAWRRTAQQASDAKAALTWLKDHELTLKNDRLRPIADQAKSIWAELRQESNVDISSLLFEGGATRRRVAIAATVDGESAGALSVMSQGELHALALAIFLPRAALPDSPFHFIVLDDPVQAMDPSKITGLIQTLERLAVDRQVVVFTHDDRLAQAGRRSKNATIVEVTRHSGSRVEIHNAVNPSRRCLDDARALTLDLELPDDTLRRVLPSLLRMALETQAYESYSGRFLGEGGSLQELEATWTSTQGTSKRVALSIYDDPRTLDGWLRKHPYRSRGLGVCTSAIHGGLKGDARLACEDVEKMVADISGRRK